MTLQNKNKIKAENNKTPETLSILGLLSLLTQNSKKTCFWASMTGQTSKVLRFCQPKTQKTNMYKRNLSSNRKITLVLTVWFQKTRPSLKRSTWKTRSMKYQRPEGTWTLNWSIKEKEDSWNTELLRNLHSKSKNRKALKPLKFCQHSAGKLEKQGKEILKWDFHTICHNLLRSSTLILDFLLKIWPVAVTKYFMNLTTEINHPLTIPVLTPKEASQSPILSPDNWKIKTRSRSISKTRAQRPETMSNSVASLKIPENKWMTPFLRWTGKKCNNSRIVKSQSTAIKKLVVLQTSQEVKYC